ncbi:GSCOCG00003415001-RA-CDS [Cotesia congregata]|nr:GSCOCG00003415001-RA-CDS [Cotesia congregata]
MDSEDDSVVVYDSDEEKANVSKNRSRSDKTKKNYSNNFIQETDDESETSSSYAGSFKDDNISRKYDNGKRSCTEKHDESKWNHNDTIDGSIKSKLADSTKDHSIQNLDETYDSEKENSFGVRQKSSDSINKHGNKIKNRSIEFTVTDKNSVSLQKSYNDSHSSNEHSGIYRDVMDKHKIMSDFEDNFSENDEVMVESNHSDFEESFIGIQKKSVNRKMNRILSDSEEDEILDIDGENKDSGRMTPSIKKAIRRSIFNMSRVSTSEPEEDDLEDDEEETDNVENESGIHRLDKKVHSFSDEESSENENEINRSEKMVQPDSDDVNDNDKYKSKKKRSSIIMSDYGEENFDDRDNQNAKQGNNSDSSKISYESLCSINDLEKSTDLQKDQNSSLSSVEITDGKKSTRSDLNRSANLSRGRASHNYSIHEDHSIHQERTSNSIIDIDSATSTEDERETQSKKNLSELNVNELKKLIQGLRDEAERAKTFLREGDVKLLPDGGENLKLLIIKNSKKIKQYQEQLNEIQPPEKSDSSVISLDQSSDASFHHHKTINDSDYEPNDSYISPKKISQKFNRTQMMKPTLETDLEGLGKKALETFKNEQALTVERLEHFHGSLLSRPTENERAEDPRGLVVSLMPHQQHALAWLMWREQQKPRGGVLADDMGLGKTLTMISLVIKTLSEDSSDDERDDDDDDDGWMGKGRQNEHRGGTLVVCPASLINQWKSEVDNRCKRGVLAVEVYHGNNREKVARRLARNDMVITTYNLVSRESKNNGQIFKIRWNRVILDEAHCIRNHKSQSCNAVCQLKATKRWALTGTPIHNKEMDIYAILKFLQCSPFDDLRVWKRWVENKSITGVERLATVMKTLMLRRTKQELISKGEVETLPEKHLDIIKVTLDKDERLVYDKVMMHSKTIFAQFLHQRAEKETLQGMGANPLAVDYRNTKFSKAQQQLLAHHANDVKSHQILVLLLRLRQICCQPALIHKMLDQEEMEMNGLENDVLTAKMMKMNISISTSEHGDDDDDDDDDDEEEEIGVDQRITENLLTSDNPVFDVSRKSSKLQVIIDIVRDILEKNEKMIIVSQWTSYLNIIGECLRKIPGATFDMFTGQVAVKNRQAIVDSFNLKKKPQILLLSLSAGGVGLNLVGGNHLILVDIHWNPQLESQAQDRIYRFGQKKNVHIYKILCSDTIEERIQLLQEKKMAIAASVIDGTGKVSSKLSLQDLKSLFDM